MARSVRLKYHGALATYHIISRTVGQEFLLKECEKEKLLDLIQHHAKLFLVQVTGFCIMDNHFHLLVQTQPYSKYSEKEIDQRIDRFYKNGKPPSMRIREQVREKLGDISRFVQYIKQDFTRWYNKRNKRTGYLWGDRFKSILLEDGCSVLPCLAYIDLNPVRAGIVKRPEEYRWSSMGMRYNGAGKGFLYFTASLGAEYSHTTQLAYYKKYVYHCGAINAHGKRGTIEKADRDAVAKEQFTFTKKQAFKKRLGYFSYGYALGSKGFLQGIMQNFTEKIPRSRKDFSPTPFSSNIYCFRRVEA